MAQVEDTATDSITPESVFARHPRSGDVDGVFYVKSLFASLYYKNRAERGNDETSDQSLGSFH